MKKKRKIHKAKNGHDYIKESYFVGGKMKFRKIYVIDGLPAEEFYKKNATDIDLCINEDYWLINYEKDSNDNCDELDKQETDVLDDEINDLPF